MFCKMCGTQLKENDKFCGGCGYRLDGAELMVEKLSGEELEEEIDDVEDDDEGSNRLSFLSMVIAFLAVVIVCIVGIMIKKSMSDARSEKSVEMKNQNAGTQFNNLGYQCGVQYPYSVMDEIMRYETGRITYSEGTIYFYEGDGIYAVNEEGERTKICPSEGASSLNMNGRYLYFLEGNYIYKVNVKTGEKEEVLLVDYIKPFFMYGDMIYYVSAEYITATQKAFCILGYDVDKKEEVVHINVGSEQPIIIEVTADGYITYYYQKSWVQNEEQKSRADVCYELRRVDGDGDVVCSAEMQSNDVYMSYLLDFTAFRGDNSIYAIWTYDYQQSLVNVLNAEQFLSQARIKADNGFLQLKNSYKDDLIVYGMINGKTALYLVPEDLLVSFDVNSPLIKEIVYESSGIVEVYVIGDYIYYTVEDEYWGGSDYDSDNLYRIKVDGTGWEDI